MGLQAFLTKSLYGDDMHQIVHRLFFLLVIFSVMNSDVYFTYKKIKLEILVDLLTLCSIETFISQRSSSQL